MDERELRQIFLERLHVEIHIFKDTILRRSKEDIFEGSFMIEVYVSFYNILVAEAERMSEPLLRKLLYQNSGILDVCYRKWLDKDTGFYTELKDYVEDELNVLEISGADRRKEQEHGE